MSTTQHISVTATNIINGLQDGSVKADSYESNGSTFTLYVDEMSATVKLQMEQRADEFKAFWITKATVTVGAESTTYQVSDATSHALKAIAHQIDADDLPVAPFMTEALADSLARLERVERFSPASKQEVWAAAQQHAGQDAEVEQVFLDEDLHAFIVYLMPDGDLTMTRVDRVASPDTMMDDEELVAETETEVWAMVDEVNQ